MPLVLLRVTLFLLPCLALALALPEVPHWFVVSGVLVGSAVWARTPDHAVGVVPLVLVVAVLLLAAHVAATLASYGPPTLAVDPRLARLWLARGALALVPVPVAWLAVRGLDPALAPSGLWLATGALTVVALLVTARLTGPERS